MHLDSAATQGADDLVKVLLVDERHGNDNGSFTLLGQVRNGGDSQLAPKREILKIVRLTLARYNFSQHESDLFRIKTIGAGPLPLECFCGRSFSRAEGAVDPANGHHSDSEKPGMFGETFNESRGSEVREIQRAGVMSKILILVCATEKNVIATVHAGVYHL